jgi:glyoxylase-like metal-dependent hydrolase (beta-lactamase superfamily II)
MASTFRTRADFFNPEGITMTSFAKSHSRDFANTSTRVRQLGRAALMAVLLGGTAATTMSLATPAYAQAPLLKKQPGYYRVMVGDFEVTALSDGTNGLPADKLLNGISKDEINKKLNDAFLTDPVETSINAFLINTGKKLILVDTGAGGLLDNNSGRLQDSLKAAGYKPSQVDEIYLTHLHLDHVGGLTQHGRRAFPNAVVRVDKKEADYWLNDQNASTASQITKPFFGVAQTTLKPYLSAGKFRPYDGDTELVPGISSVANYGHTPGHNAYLVSSKGQRLLIVGDMVHVGVIQFAQPNITIGFDSDEHEAMADRRKSFDAIADQRELIAAAHVSFPGIGHLVKEGDGYRWFPINYGLAK